MPTFLDHALILIITVGLPSYALFLWHMRLMRSHGSQRGAVRLQTYRLGVIVPWSLTILVALVWFQRGRLAPDIGLGFEPNLRFWTSAAIVAMIMAYASWQRLTIHDDAEAKKEVMEQLGSVEALLPRTPFELQWFFGVSITAGICEEFLYRGFLMWYLEQLTGPVAAVVISSLLFGIGHAYQGSRGMIQTGLVGLALALLYVFSGSLWLPILLHAFIDINSGLLAYDVLRQGNPSGLGTVAPKPPADPWE